MHLTISVYFPPECDSYETGILWVRSRRRVQSETSDAPSEIDDDKEVKKHFLDVTGQDFEMVYFTRPLCIIRRRAR